MASDKALKAARRADWAQVAGNGGPPCFRVMEDGDFCLRAERWPGHEPDHDHEFVSLAALLDSFAAQEREACRQACMGQATAFDCERAIRARGGSK